MEKVCIVWLLERRCGFLTPVGLGSVPGTGDVNCCDLWTPGGRSSNVNVLPGMIGFAVVVLLSIVHTIGCIACEDARFLTSDVPCQNWRLASRLSLSFFMLSAASLRRNKKLVKYLLEPIVPPPLPARLCVMASGALEGIGGLLLLVPGMEFYAGLLVLVMLVAVFPANVYHALSPTAQKLTRIGPPTVYIRLPIQALFVYWARWHVL